MTDMFDFDFEDADSARGRPMEDSAESLSDYEKAGARSATLKAHAFERFLSTHQVQMPNGEIVAVLLDRADSARSVKNKVLKNAEAIGHVATNSLMQLRSGTTSGTLRYSASTPELAPQLRAPGTPLGPMGPEDGDAAVGPAGPPLPQTASPLPLGGLSRAANNGSNKGRSIAGGSAHGSLRFHAADGGVGFPDAAAPALLDSPALGFTFVGNVKEGVCELIDAVNAGVRAGAVPAAEPEGLGGVYTLRSAGGRRLAVFKPADEEPFAPNNPKGFTGRRLNDPGLKPSVPVGQACLREVAAYLLDYGGFASVPRTALVHGCSPAFHMAPAPPRLGGARSPTGHIGQTGSSPHVPTKRGSLQEFVHHDSDANDCSPSRFPVSAVHRIGILDIRLLNTDRHAGNILVRRKAPLDAAGTLTTGGTGDPGASVPGVPRSVSSPLSFGPHAVDLIPIDHGFALPETLEPPYWEWLHWPQAQLPFSPEELAYIAARDTKADARRLYMGCPKLPPACARILTVGTTLLQKCASAGFTLAEIGQLMSRPLVGIGEDRSALERICARASRRAIRACGREPTTAVGSDSDSDGGEECDPVIGPANGVRVYRTLGAGGGTTGGWAEDRRRASTVGEGDEAVESQAVTTPPGVMGGDDPSHHMGGGSAAVLSGSLHDLTLLGAGALAVAEVSAMFGLSPDRLSPRSPTAGAGGLLSASDPGLSPMSSPSASMGSLGPSPASSSPQAMRGASPRPHTPVPGHPPLPAGPRGARNPTSTPPVAGFSGSASSSGGGSPPPWLSPHVAMAAAAVTGTLLLPTTAVSPVTPPPTRVPLSARSGRLPPQPVMIPPPTPRTPASSAHGPSSSFQPGGGGHLLHMRSGGARVMGGMPGAGGSSAGADATVGGRMGGAGAMTMLMGIPAPGGRDIPSRHARVPPAASPSPTRRVRGRRALAGSRRACVSEAPALRFDMPDDEWAAFSTAYKELVEAAIDDGSFRESLDANKQVGPGAAFGSSCPRF